MSVSRDRSDDIGRVEDLSRSVGKTRQLCLGKLLHRQKALNVLEREQSLSLR